MTAQATKPRVLGRVDETALIADLERYRQLALEMGASAAEVISAGDVVVDERVRLKCLVPRCLRAGETPNCPPNVPDLALIRRALRRYTWAVLFKCDVSPLEDYAPGKGATRAEQRRTLAFHQKSGEVVYALERQAYRDGYHLAMGFGGGSCKDYLCQGVLCQFLDSGRCRFPQRARPAMEAMGIDVIDLINKVGWESYALLDDLSAIPCAITVGIVFIC
jgi:predicted metal-binding protein